MRVVGSVTAVFSEELEQAPSAFSDPSRTELHASQVQTLQYYEP